MARGGRVAGGEIYNGRKRIMWNCDFKLFLVADTSPFLHSVFHRLSVSIYC